MKSKKECGQVYEGCLCKIVYKLMNEEHKEECKQGDDDCLCFGGVCNRSTQYVYKDDKPFYLGYEEVNCKDENGKILKTRKVKYKSVHN